MSKRKSNKKVKQMIKDVFTFNMACVSKDVKYWYSCGENRPPVLMVEATINDAYFSSVVSLDPVSLTANQLKGIE